MHIIKNRKNILRNAPNAAIKKLRADMLDIIEEVVSASDPYAIVTRAMRTYAGGKLIFCGQLKLDIRAYKRIFVIGAGKGTYQMARAIEKLLGTRVADGFIAVGALQERCTLKVINHCVAGHPFPNKNAITAAKKILKIVRSARKDDLIIGLFSGGGSAMLDVPPKGVTLPEMVALTGLLIKSKAGIDEINIVRKHISCVKGGQLACSTAECTMVNLYLSDVVGDSLATVASGPTVPDESTFNEAIEILRRYELWNKTPATIRAHLKKGTQGKCPETPKENNEVFCSHRVYNFLIGGHAFTLEAASRAAQRKGYAVLPWTHILHGDVSNAVARLFKKMRVWKRHVNIQVNARPHNGEVAQRSGKRRAQKPLLLIATGETTMHVRGTGVGGRNQQAVIESLALLKEGEVFTAFDTDGIDGVAPEYVGGAIADAHTLVRGNTLDLNADKMALNNDPYNYFKPLRELLITGPTGTNIGDIVMIGERRH